MSRLLPFRETPVYTFYRGCYLFLSLKRKSVDIAHSVKTVKCFSNEEDVRTINDNTHIHTLYKGK